MSVTRWTTIEYSKEAAEALRTQCNLPRHLAVILSSRGFRTAEEVHRFFEPRLSRAMDPFLMQGMKEAVARITQAITDNEPIAVFGDYDVDGVTSTALMSIILRRLGGDVSTFIPNRIDEGYGLNEVAIHRCVETLHPRLIITVDCGTNAFASTEWARSQGIDVIITDHHEPTDQVANAVAIVNPKLDHHESIRMLASVGVTYKVCDALLKSFGRDASDPDGIDLRDYLDIVALGTICDMVPLHHENRIFAYKGIHAFRNKRSMGLTALVDEIGIRNDIESYHLGFQLGPRLNSVGRLEDARDALLLLMTEDVKEAARLAEYLDRRNKERQEIERSTFEEARKQIEEYFDPDRDYVVVAAGRGWHAGVVAIVASRVLATFHRPAVVIALGEDDVGRGSCRSISEFNIVENLDCCAPHLIKYGGHAMAAGLEIHADEIPMFRKRLNDRAHEVLVPANLVPHIAVDMWISLRDLNETLYFKMQQMKPFGMDNPEPVFGFSGLQIVQAEKVGIDNKHYRLQMRQDDRDIWCIAYNQADKPLPEGPVDIVANMLMVRNRGQRSVELRIMDMKGSDPNNML